MALRAATGRLAPLGGRGRFVVAFSLFFGLVGFVAFLAYGPDLAPENYALGALFLAALSGALAYFIHLTFSLVTWVLDGHDESSRRNFSRFIGICLLVVGVAGLLVLFRHEVGGLQVENGKCWYAVRDRWTGVVKVEEQSCSRPKTPDRRFARIFY